MAFTQCDSIWAIRAQFDDAFKGALAAGGYFDVVINNAGRGHFGPAEHLSDEEILKQFQTRPFSAIFS